MTNSGPGTMAKLRRCLSDSWLGHPLHRALLENVEQAVRRPLALNRPCREYRLGSNTKKRDTRRRDIDLREHQHAHFDDPYPLREPMTALAGLTRDAVLRALEEFRSLGRQAFLDRYGFGRARAYFVRDPANDELCDSKAIAGAAFGFVSPGHGALKAGTFSGGEATVSQALAALGFEVVHSLGAAPPEPTNARADWSTNEVALIVSDYLQMLTLELSGQRYNKAAHRRALVARLNERSESSVEFKHRNISAVMLDLGFPPLRGYLPLFNYQKQALTDTVVAQLGRFPTLDQAAHAAVEMPAHTPELLDFSKVRTEAPAAPPPRVEDGAGAYRIRTPVRRDYLEREARNRSLGLAGEMFVLAYERWRLIELGAERLANRVEHVSATQGDGLGFDVLSFEATGRERLIEVKTTAFSETTPFYVSVNEVQVAQERSEQYRLYRLFNFRVSPRLFELPGAIETHCRLDPASYRANMR